MSWHNLAFPDSDASFESPANIDEAAAAAAAGSGGAVVFAQDNDASIDIDALGFTYSGNFAVELLLKPADTQVACTYTPTFSPISTHQSAPSPLPCHVTCALCGRRCAHTPLMHECIHSWHLNERERGVFSYCTCTLHTCDVCTSYRRWAVW